MEHDKLNENAERIARHFEKANFGGYVDLLNSPGKMMGINFVAGLFRGLGIAVGMTVIFAIAAFIAVSFLKSFINIPIIGSYIAQLVEFVNLSLKNGIKP